jgi:D-inositol-3-phosphate glycosyltransferase
MTRMSFARQTPRPELRRVAIVSEHASPLIPPGSSEAGGQNIHVAGLALELGRRGLDVVIHTRRDDAYLPEQVELAPNVVVDHVDAGPATHVAREALLPLMDDFAEELSRKWARNPPDVVHSHYWMSGLAALVAGRSHEIPVVHTFHALGSEKRRHLGKRDPSPTVRIEAERRVASEVDTLVATSAAEVEELAAMGAHPARVAVIPCGVDTTLFTPNGPAEMHGSQMRLAVVGRLVERKGVGDVVRALQLLPGIELVVAGGSGDEQDAEAEELRALAERAGVAARVDFRGPVPHDRLPALLRSADAVVCVPWYEPFGLVALESAACGRPVVASAVGGLRETVVDGITGVLVPPRAPCRLAVAARGLLADAELRSRLGSAAAVHAAQFSWSRIAAATIQAYFSVLAARPPAPVR